MELLRLHKSDGSERIPDIVLSVNHHPPNLRLIECCSKCRYGRQEGISIECRKFSSKYIALYAICDDFEQA